jgi:hypothetical protein
MHRKTKNVFGPIRTTEKTFVVCSLTPSGYLKLSLKQKTSDKAAVLRQHGSTSGIASKDRGLTIKVNALVGAYVEWDVGHFPKLTKETKP